MREAQTPAPKPEKGIKDRGNFEVPYDIDAMVKKGLEAMSEQTRILGDLRRQREKQDLERLQKLLGEVDDMVFKREGKKPDKPPTE